ncbi:Spermidine/putrescine transport ATP-binding protein potA [Indibacter alkaliphilus LW1]|uniref:Spermidine/putrescine transport ATP-binding protein potA n=1 Tax=Indibacter alkaliphilus (strain CCUG 57479 / KCTC 22604 / LW1) TaxID=1189612 RepID=S2D2F4_INDAL|nr:ABC transporter ATP-binding protein [Indibacter alkaliphilus]EOZ93502.1 Spermidine/putrescine transport ATP-binding protein potA [Indibacter alkaliphilus LW1]
MTFLKISKVIKAYQKDKPILSDFSMNINSGQVISLVGESGSGKSTLLRIIAGTENRDSGEVYLGDMLIQNPKEKLVPGYDEIQLVYQEYKLYPNSTVEENILRPLLLYDKSYRKYRLEKLLELLGLQDFRNNLPKELSGGQQQKVAIARALSLEPKVLLLDEPFSSLDTIQRRELITELKNMFKSLGVTVIFVTHDLDDALQLTDQLVILQNGKIVQEGKPAEIFSKPQNMYAAKLFSHLNKIPGKKKKFIRPTDISLFKTSGLPVLVKDVQYLVHYNQLTVKLSNGEIWLLEDKNRKFAINEKLHVKWEPEKELLIK